MGNYFQSKETESDEFKEPKMADEKLEIPKDTPENLENKEEPKQAKIEKEEVEISNENPEEEEHKSNEKEEEDIHNEEQNEEQNQEQKDEQNEEKNEEEDEVLKTPIKNRTYDPAENNKVLQHNDDIQRNKIIIESSLDQHHEARPINQMNQRENAENQEINESYELNPEQNANNEKNTNKIVYHNIAFRSGKKQNNFDINKIQKEQFVKKEIYKFKNVDEDDEFLFIAIAKQFTCEFVGGNTEENVIVDYSGEIFSTSFLGSYTKAMSMNEIKFGEKNVKLIKNIPINTTPEKFYVMYKNN